MGKDPTLGNGKICYVEMPATEYRALERVLSESVLAGTSENVAMASSHSDDAVGKSVARG